MCFSTFVPYNETFSICSSIYYKSVTHLQKIKIKYSWLTENKADPSCKLSSTALIHSQVDGELMLAPGFPAPPNTDYVGYHVYIGKFTKFVYNIYYK